MTKTQRNLVIAAVVVVLAIIGGVSGNGGSSGSGSGGSDPVASLCSDYSQFLAQVNSNQTNMSDVDASIQKEQDLKAQMASEAQDAGDPYASDLGWDESVMPWITHGDDPLLKDCSAAGH